MIGFLVSELPILTGAIFGGVAFLYRSLSHRLTDQDQALVKQNQALAVMATKLGQHDSSIRDLWDKLNKTDRAVSSLRESTAELSIVTQLLQDGKITK